MTAFNRSIILGDLHGCVQEFADLVKLVNYRKGKDQLILVGDLVDRGPDSHGVIRLAEELGAKMVLGNHDEKVLRYHRHETLNLINPMQMTEEKKKVYKTLTEEDFQYLNTCPFYIRLDNFVIVHGGVKPNIPVEKQFPDDIVRLRYIDKKTFLRVSLRNHNKKPDESVFWADVYTGPDTIVYGHEPANLVFPVIRPETNGLDRPLSIGLDTGVCFGGHLSCLIIDNKNKSLSIEQVKARAVYDKRYVLED